MMLGVTELVVQTGEARFVVDCKVNPVKFVNHIKTVFEPEGVKIIDGWSRTVRVRHCAPHASGSVGDHHTILGGIRGRNIDQSQRRTRLLGDGVNPFILLVA